MWQNTSGEPSSGSRKPYPFIGVNHLTSAVIRRAGPGSAARLWPVPVPGPAAMRPLPATGAKDAAWGDAEEKSTARIRETSGPRLP